MSRTGPLNVPILLSFYHAYALKCLFVQYMCVPSAQRSDLQT